MGLLNLPPDDPTDLHGLPPYIYAPNGFRAFLTISANIHGEWGAGYTLWYDTPQPNMSGAQLIGPYAQGAHSIDEALSELAVAVREEANGRRS